MAPVQGQDALRLEALGDGHNGGIRKVDVLVAILIEDGYNSLHRGLTRLDGDMQAQLYTSVPTLENGGAITRTVSVSTGDMVVNVDGVIGPLTAGDQVVNAAGQVVTYTAGAIDMTQVVVTGSYLNNMRWSNGNPLIQADLRLWDAVNCDPNSGATWSFQNQCQLTAQRD